LLSAVTIIKQFCNVGTLLFVEEVACQFLEQVYVRPKISIAMSLV
jgi:hypothetical protein